MKQEELLVLGGLATVAAAGYFLVGSGNFGLAPAPSLDPVSSFVASRPVSDGAGTSVSANGPCNGSYNPWASNAANWMQKMGYPTNFLGDSKKPEVSDMQLALRTHPNLLYWLMHGDYAGVRPWGCPDDNHNTAFPENQCLTASHVAASLPKVQKGKLAFLGSCRMFCADSTETDKISAARYGNILELALNSYECVVGYYNMYEMGRAWSHSLDWQNDFFSSLALGSTAQSAYEYAQSRAWAGRGKNYDNETLMLNLADHIKIAGNSSVCLVDGGL